MNDDLGPSHCTHPSIVGCVTIDGRVDCIVVAIPHTPGLYSCASEPSAATTAAEDDRRPAGLRACGELIQGIGPNEVVDIGR